MMSSIKIEPVGFALGARITGLDLNEEVNEQDFQKIMDAWVKHLLLVFPGQKIGPEALARFTSRFGELDDFESQPFNRHPDHKHVMLLTNRRSGNKPSPTHNAGQNWHTDLSYTLRPAKATSLYCMEKPAVGGDTMFANMYLAYETLSPTLQNILDDLEAVNDASLIEGLSKRGPEIEREFKRLNPPVVHPAVRLHPDSGRKALYINQRVRQFVGMTEAESKPLIDFLCAHSISPRFVYRHSWTIGDLVMWDNRCLTHLAVGDYDPNEIRLMIRTSGKGDYYGRLLNPEQAPDAATSSFSSKDVAAGVAALAD